VPELDKREVVLRFLAAHDLPFRTKQLYGALIYQTDITFSYRTMQSLVQELSERGYLDRVEIDEQAGEVRPLPSADERRLAYYVLSEHGRLRAAGL
jgi:hypothetical protein